MGELFVLFQPGNPSMGQEFLNYEKKINDLFHHQTLPKLPQILQNFSNDFKQQFQRKRIS
jgi:hypothetical protein